MKFVDGYQAIVTRYHGPTNAHGARVSARALRLHVFLQWDDRLNSEANHRAAAMALATKLGWIDPRAKRQVQFVHGGMPSGADRVWVQFYLRENGE